MIDFLSPDYHSRGVMTAVLRALMEAWVVPQMNVHTIRLCVLEGNIGSIRVFEKNGFEVSERSSSFVVLVWRKRS